MKSKNKVRDKRVEKSIKKDLNGICSLILGIFGTNFIDN